MMTTELELASTLGVRQKANLLALEPGQWGKVPFRETAKTMWYGITRNGRTYYLIDHKHCPTDEREWMLNERGEAFADALRIQGKE